MNKIHLIFAMALIFLVLNCIPKYVSSHSGADGNLWTTTRSNPNEVFFRFRPASGDFCRVSSYHFGFPLRAFYYDRGHVIDFQPPPRIGEAVWFVKLDIFRLAANLFLILSAASFATLISSRLSCWKALNGKISAKRSENIPLLFICR